MLNRRRRRRRRRRRLPLATCKLQRRAGSAFNLVICGGVLRMWPLQQVYLKSNFVRNRRRCLDRDAERLHIMQRLHANAV
jgi:hypothetical protein